MSDISISIAAAAIKGLLPKDLPLKERAEAAFQIAKDEAKRAHIFWMTSHLNDDTRFRSACAAILMGATEDERAIIEKSLAAVRALNALMSGVPVAFEGVDTEGILPLLSMFQEAGEQKGGGA